MGGDQHGKKTWVRTVKAVLSRTRQHLHAPFTKEGGENSVLEEKPQEGSGGGPCGKRRHRRQRRVVVACAGGAGKSLEALLQRDVPREKNKLGRAIPGGGARIGGRVGR